MSESKGQFRIELTPEQKAKVRNATGRDAEAVELSVEGAGRADRPDQGPPVLSRKRHDRGGPGAKCRPLLAGPALWLLGVPPSYVIRPQSRMFVT